MPQARVDVVAAIGDAVEQRLADTNYTYSVRQEQDAIVKSRVIYHITVFEIDEEEPRLAQLVLWGREHSKIEEQGVKAINTMLNELLEGNS